MTALHFAVQNPRGEGEGIVMRLLAHPKIDVNRKDATGRSALHIAIESWGSPRSLRASLVPPILQQLLKHQDINVNIFDNTGASPLMLAAREGYTGIVKKLLTRPEIEINIENKYGRTALDLAKRYSRKDTAKLLEAAGAF